MRLNFKMAGSVGFEPTVALTPHQFSRLPP